LFASPSKANFIYTYAGNPFSQFGNASCLLKATFRVRSPSPNRSARISLRIFTSESSFTDGAVMITQANATSSVFGIITNSLGAITVWNTFAITVRDGIAQADRCALIEDDEVRLWRERRERP
jgi:hypothetical protein